MIISLRVLCEMIGSAGLTLWTTLIENLSCFTAQNILFSAPQQQLEYDVCSALRFIKVKYPTVLFIVLHNCHPHSYIMQYAWYFWLEIKQLPVIVANPTANQQFCGALSSFNINV